MEVKQTKSEKIDFLTFSSGGEFGIISVKAEKQYSKIKGKITIVWE